MKIKSKWKHVREIIDSEPISLGPFYSGQLKGHWSLLRTMARYKFVADMVKGKVVLDIGCGEGLGTFLLSKYTSFIDGVDNDLKAIQYANATWRAPLRFKCEDFLRTHLYNTHDVTIAIDVIEHIEKKQVKDFMNTMLLPLKDNGFCIIGTPNKNMKKYESKEAKAGHVNMYDEKGLRKLMEKYFNTVFIFGMNDETLYTGFKPMCQYLFAIGVNKK